MYQGLKTAAKLSFDVSLCVSPDYEIGKFIIIIDRLVSFSCAISAIENRPMLRFVGVSMTVVDVREICWLQRK